MAQTGYTPISIYYSSTAAATPTAGNLVAGELAINTADGKLFYKDSAGVVQVIAGKAGAGVAGGSTTQVQYNSSGSLAGSANLTYDGTTFTTTGAANFATSTGNVGIGKSSYGSMTTDGVWIEKGSYNQISTTSNSNATLFLNQNGTGAMQEWRLANAVKGTFNQYGLGLGTAVPSNGVGITFPATQSASSDANTLDDYEEGTWTPTIVGSTTAGTASYPTAQGFYTKIGNRVFLQCYINWTSGTGTGNLLIGNLPFTTSSSANSQGGLTIGYINNVALTSLNYAFALLQPTKTTVDLYQYPVGGGSTNPITYDSAGELVVTGTYFV